MAGIQMFAEQMRLMTPHTFNALQKMVMSMADVTKNKGKKTWFGRDKGQESYSKFLSMLKATIQAMILDGVVQESTPTDDVVAQLLEKLQKFEMAFPNWQDAYGFAKVFFENNKQDALATVERLRSIP